MNYSLLPKVFVYGSLLSKLSNHHILLDLESQCRLISDQCISVEKFFLTGLKSNEYPYLSDVPLQNGQVSYQIKGELYELSDEALAKLDLFEEHPVEYLRSMIRVQDLSVNEKGKLNAELCSVYDVNVYLLKNEERIAEARADFDSKFVLVNGGDWRLHLSNL